MVQERKIIASLNGNRWSKNVTKLQKFNIYEITTESWLIYDVEIWRTTERHKRKWVESVEIGIDTIRRILRVLKKENKKLKIIKKMMALKGPITDAIEKKQLTWYAWG